MAFKPAHKCTAKQPIKVIVGDIIPWKSTLWRILRPKQNNTGWVIVRAIDGGKMVIEGRKEITNADLIKILSSKTYRKIKENPIMFSSSPSIPETTRRVIRGPHIPRRISHTFT